MHVWRHTISASGGVQKAAVEEGPKTTVHF